jgi:hypothetical protein
MIDTTGAENTRRTMNTGKDLERTRRRKEGIEGGMKEWGGGRTGQAPKGQDGMKKGRKARRWRWTGRMAAREQE